MNDLRTYPADPALQPLIQAIGVGVDEDLIGQLVTNSRQAPMLEFTPKDAAVRFKDTAAFHAWQAKGRTVHWLLAEHDQLAGIIWYGPAACPQDLGLDFVPDETFAIRIYEGFNGHGLARPFMLQSLRLYVQQKQAAGQPINGFWLETDLDNPAARATYTKFGYQVISHDEARMMMVLSPSKIAELTQS